MLKLFFCYASVTLFLLSNKLYSQENSFDNYVTIKSKGEIPLDFRKPSYEKYEDDVKLNISKEEKKRLRKSKDEFYLSTNYYIDELLTSGNVLFGDTLTTFVNEVAKELLQKSGKSNLIEKLRFYVVKSSQVNAFATQQGIIFVTNGLLSQIHNKEQLAFVLAHEISHYEKNHNINTFLQKEKLKKDFQKGKREFKNLLKTLSSFSQAQELEADEDGLNIFVKAGYSPQNALTLLKVLEYSHLPFDEVKFEEDFFNKDNYVLPLDYFGDSTSQDITYEDREEEKYSSHPDIDKREKLIEELIIKKGYNNNDKVTASKQFNYIQKISRFENLHINLLGGEYTRVVYEGYLLDRLYPNNSFIKESIAKALYGIAKIKTYSDYSSSYEDIAESFEGESKVLYELFYDELLSVEATVLALKYMSGVENSNLYDYKVDLVLDLIKKHELELEDFLKSKNLAKDSVIEKIDTHTIVYGDSIWNSMTKIEKLNYKKKKEKQVENNSEIIYYKLAFTEELKDSAFVNLFKVAADKNIFKTTKEIASNMNYTQRKKYYNEIQKQVKKPIKLGIDTLMILSPSYTVINKYKTKKVDSEKKEIQYNEIVKECANKNDLTVKIFSSKLYSEDDLEIFNDETLIKEWLSEYGYYVDYHMIPMTQKKMLDISDKYNTNDLLLIGISRYKKPKIYNSALLFPSILPFYLIYLSYNPFYNDFYYAVINTEDISFKMFHVKKTKGKDQVLRVKAFTYDTFYHIKNK